MTEKLLPIRKIFKMKIRNISKTPVTRFRCTLTHLPRGSQHSFLNSGHFLKYPRNSLLIWFVIVITEGEKCTHPKSGQTLENVCEI